jgi:hypothetical protein
MSWTGVNDSWPYSLSARHDDLPEDVPINRPRSPTVPLSYNVTEVSVAVMVLDPQHRPALGEPAAGTGKDKQGHGRRFPSSVHAEPLSEEVLPESLQPLDGGSYRRDSQIQKRRKTVPRDRWSTSPDAVAALQLGPDDLEGNSQRDGVSEKCKVRSSCHAHPPAPPYSTARKPRNLHLNVQSGAWPSVTS